MNDAQIWIYAENAECGIEHLVFWPNEQGYYLHMCDEAWFHKRFVVWLKKNNKNELFHYEAKSMEKFTVHSFAFAITSSAAIFSTKRFMIQ